MAAFILWVYSLYLVLPGSGVISFGGHPASGRTGQKEGNIPSICLHVGLALGEGGNHWVIISLARYPSHNRPSLNYPLSVKFKPLGTQGLFNQGYTFVACLPFPPFKLQVNWITSISWYIISIPPSLQPFLLWNIISLFRNFHALTSSPLFFFISNSYLKSI